MSKAQNKKQIVFASVVFFLFISFEIASSYSQEGINWVKACVLIMAWLWVTLFLANNVTYVKLNEGEKSLLFSSYKPEIQGGYKTIVKHSVWFSILVSIILFIVVLNGHA